MKRRAAVFTIVQNESYFLPKWIRYYIDHFIALDIYILDHGSADNSINDINPYVKVISVHRSESFNHVWLRETVQTFQRFLLQSYECVLFAECDELILAEDGLRIAIADFMKSKADAVKCRGVEVIDRHGKQSFESSRWYDKVLLSKWPLSWSNGFHEVAVPFGDICRIEGEPQLWLVHTHRANYAACRAKHRQTAARKWSETDIANGAGAHNRIQTDEEFDKWFYRHDGPAIQLPESILRQL